MIKRLLFYVLLCVATVASAQELSDQARVSIITGGPGLDLYSLFGHSAVRVYDPVTRKNEMYNYGTFDFDAPGFMFKFLRGKLLYYSAGDDYRRFLALYNYEKRSVQEQMLDISPAEVKSIYRQLLRDTTEEHKFYHYDFFYDNCTTRLRDLLSNNVDGLNYPKQTAGDYTMRELLHLNLGPHPWTKFGMDIILGATTDKKSTVADQMFLPAFYHDYLNQSEVNGEPLVQTDRYILMDEEKDDYQLWFSPMQIFVGVFLFELLLFFFVYISGDQRWACWLDRVWFWALFLCFWVFVFMWFATDHEVCSRNWNILWTIPWMPFLLSSSVYKEHSIRIMIFASIVLQVVLLLGWKMWPQAMPPEAVFIALISTVKMVRQGGFYRFLDRLFYKKQVVAALFLLPFFSVSLLAQYKIGGVSLVAPPAPFSTDPMIEIAEANADWVAVIPFGFSRKGAAEVHYDTERQWWGERPEGIKETIKLAHQNGIKVMLKPQVWIPRGWVGEMDFSREKDWLKWEESYREYIMTHAQIAAEMNVAMLCIGTEYKISVVKREKYWRQLIKDIRELYSGKLTYSANWDSYQRVPFWDVLDYVGVSAYFPLDESDGPSPLRLYMRWKPIIQQLKVFSDKHQKKILFTEYGYLSVDGCAGKTWELENRVKKLNVNEEAQASALSALYRSFWNQDFWAGGFIWKWFPEGKGHEGYPERDYTPQGKEALKVITQWYGRS